LHGVAFVLQQVDQVHNLLLPQFQVLDFILHGVADFVQLGVFGSQHDHFFVEIVFKTIPALKLLG